MRNVKNLLDALISMDYMRVPTGMEQRLERQEPDGSTATVDSWVLCGLIDGDDLHDPAGGVRAVWRSYNLGADGQVYRVQAQILGDRDTAELPRELVARGPAGALTINNPFMRVDEHGIAGIPAIEDGLVELAVYAGVDPAIFN